MHVLIIEDDPLLARALMRLIEPYGQGETASTLEAATRLIAERNFDAHVVDLVLPDGSGMDWAAQMRARSRALPILILTGLQDRPLINRAAELGAFYALKPLAHEVIIAFLERCRRGYAATPVTPSELARQEAQRARLSRRQLEILELCLDGLGREAVIERLGITAKTYANHVTAILDKTGEATMSALVIRLLRGAGPLTE